MEYIHLTWSLDQWICGTSFQSDKLGYAKATWITPAWSSLLWAHVKSTQYPHLISCVSTCSSWCKVPVLHTTADQVDKVARSLWKKLFPLMTWQVPLRIWKAISGGKTVCTSSSGSKNMSAIPGAPPWLCSLGTSAELESSRARLVKGWWGLSSLVSFHLRIKIIGVNDIAGPFSWLCSISHVVPGWWEHNE